MMLPYTFNSVGSTLCRRHISLDSLLVSYRKYSTLKQTIKNTKTINSQEFLFRSRPHTTVSVYKNIFHRNCQTINVSTIENGGKLFCSPAQLLRYSTQSEEGLSFSNVKVQNYVSHLREKYKNALENRDPENIQISRNLQPLMELIGEMEELKSDIEELKELAKDSSNGEEMQQLAKNDLQDASNRLLSLQEDVLNALIPSEPLDNTDVSLEVSAGVGGQEAMLFCQEVFDMYLAYSDYMGWQAEVTRCEKTDIGGVRRGEALISGEGAHRLLKYEGGIHRVQRIPKTEKSGRIHTSTVSVAVMPMPTEIDIQIANKDLKIETKRASGAGGQHVNTTDSAVRILHIPTGIVVECQEERSQHRNREAALGKLRALLYQKQLDENICQYSSSRKLQVGTRARSEKIRTYNYPQDRVTDHRIGVTIHNLPSLLEGTEALHSLICQVIKEAERESLLEIIINIPTENA